MKRAMILLFVSTAPAYGTDASLYIGAIDYNKPVDSVNDFNLLTGTWNSEQSTQFCPSTQSPGQKDKASIVSSSASSGYSAILDGVTYTIFSTNVDGIGWIMGAKDTWAPEWTPLTSKETIVYPFSGTSNPQVNIGANTRFAYVKLPGYLSPGQNILPAQKIGEFKCYFNNSLRQTASIYVQSATINIAALSCNVTSAKNVPIPLGVFTKSDLPSVGRNFGNYSTDVQLNCDSGVTPWMTITDASNSNNTSNVIVLSPDSTASGIGVQVFYNNESAAKSLGLDTSSKANKNQFQVGSITTKKGQIVSVPLTFKYIRTEENVNVGTANATATVTFSYQ